VYRARTSVILGLAAYFHFSEANGYYYGVNTYLQRFLVVAAAGCHSLAAENPASLFGTG
jgi:hypothetical protein